jgi:hypothetical protein
MGICFSLYYGLYSAPFNEGAIQGSHGFSYVAKFIGLGFLVLGFMPYKFARRTPWQLWAYVILNGLFLANYALAHVLYGDGDTLFLNQILLVPFSIFLFTTTSDETVSEAMDTLLPLLAAQIFISFALYALDISLWQNKAFVGGMGNPNSFGLALIICLIYVWTIQKNKHQFLLSTLLIIPAVMTQSLMIACLLFLTPLILYIFNRNIFTFAKREAQYIIILSACSWMGLANHMTFKILATAHKFGLAPYYDVPAGSLEGRVDQIRYVERFTDLSSFGAFFWGHGDGASFTPIDPQYLCYSLNFGIVLTVIFGVLNLFFLIKAWNTDPKYRTFLFAALLAFNFSFLTNRLLAYFPMGFLYALIITAIFKHQKFVAPENRP